MESDAKPNRKGGRPSKDPAGGKRPTVTFRCRTSLQSQLHEAATAADRSLSEEIERRLERSFSPNVLALYLEFQYKLLIDHFGGEDKIFSASILNSIFREAVEMARATKPETSDWVSDPELRAKVSEGMKGSVPNFIESLTISRGAIETYKKLFALNPKIMDASDAHSNDMDAWLKNMKQS